MPGAVAKKPKDRFFGFRFAKFRKVFVGVLSKAGRLIER